MGREWHWSRSLMKRREEEGDVQERSTPGCMNGMLQLLHFRQLLLFPSHHHHQPHRRRAPAPATTRESSLEGGIRAQALDFTRGIHQPFATLLAEANQDGTPTSVRLGAGQPLQAPAAAVDVTEYEKKKETTWLTEDDGRSLQGETPRTSNVVARLMGLDELPVRPDATSRRFHPSPAAHVTSQPSPLKPCLKHDHQKENPGSKKRQRRLQGKAGCGGDGPPPDPVPRRKPLSVRNTNVVLEMEGSRSLPGTPRLSSSGRWSCDGETPRLSLQLSTPAMKEFDYLCEIVPESQHLHAAAPRTPSISASFTRKSGSKDLSAQPQQLRDHKRRAAGSGIASKTVPKQQGNESGAGKRSGGLGGDGNGDNLVGRRRTGHEKKKTRRSPSSACCSDLTVENTSETKQVLADTVAVRTAEEAVSDPLPCSSSSRFLEYRVGAGKKPSCRAAPKPTTTDRFTEKLRRPPSEKAAAVRSRSVPTTLTGTSKSLTVQSNIQPPSPTPWRPSPQPLTPPLVPPPTVWPIEEMRGEKLVPGLSPSPHGNTDCRRRRSTRRPGDDDKEYCCHPEFRYVRMILECVGLLNNASHGRRPATLARWHSLSHPVDPTVFYRLELFLPDEEDELRQLGRLRHRCNRKLLFHLVEEILADLLRRTSLGVKPCWPSHYKAAGNMTAAVVMGKKDGGVALVRHLWSRIRRLRPADGFQDIRDMDARQVVRIGSTDGDALGRVSPLHDHDMREEVESIATVIEEGIFDVLIEELKANC